MTWQHLHSLSKRRKRLSKERIALQLHTSHKVEKVIVTGFLLVVLAGALLLLLSNRFIYGIDMSPADALFMSTSAVCVTGLATVSVYSDMGLVSQIILVLLIQIGGLGFMTAMVFLSLAVGKRIGIKSRLFFLGGLGLEGINGAVHILKMILRYTFYIESIGAAILFAGFMANGESLATSIYYAIFHSVSAFCNAGFSPIDGGLRPFAHTFIVPFTIMCLIILGGIGFPVVSEFLGWLKTRKRLSHYTKMVLFLTFWLIVIGTVLIIISDWNKAFKDMPYLSRIWNALFASVTARTAGFDTVDPARFSGLGQAVTIILMVIGASPSSTGGGIKTTTLGVLAISVWNELRGRKESTFMNRSISSATERRALALTVVYIATFMIGAIIITILEELPFSAIIYEASSAIGTVGLSLGITPSLSAPSKLVLIALMFWGRVGILSFFATLITADKRTEVHYPETHIPVG